MLLSHLNNRPVLLTCMTSWFEAFLGGAFTAPYTWAGALNTEEVVTQDPEESPRLQFERFIFRHASFTCLGIACGASSAYIGFVPHRAGPELENMFFKKRAKFWKFLFFWGGSSGARETCFPENASPPKMQDGWRRAGNKAGMFGLVNHED